MTNIIEKLRTISNQVQADETARDEARRVLRQSETEARISQRREEINNLALEAAQKGDTSLTVSILDFKKYGCRYQYERHKTITPDALQGDDRLVAEALIKEGFEIFIGYVEPWEDRYGVPDSTYNYLGITWGKNTDKIKP